MRILSVNALLVLLLLGSLIFGISCKSSNQTTTTPPPTPTPKPSISPAGPANSPWPMPGHDAQHTGRSSYYGPITPQLKWSFNSVSLSPFTSSPVIGTDGTIYVGTLNGRLCAIDAQGKFKWDYALGYQVKASPAIAAGNTIYIGSWDNKFYAINGNGSVKWIYNTTSSIESSPVIVADGTIYFGSHDGTVYALQ